MSNIKSYYRLRNIQSTDRLTERFRDQLVRRRCYWIRTAHLESNSRSTRAVTEGYSPSELDAIRD